jgi:hypothetical protein
MAYCSGYKHKCIHNKCGCMHPVKRHHWCNPKTCTNIEVRL